MRLSKVTLEKYGFYDRRTLNIADDVGLTIIYGANEAGKSTCLEAISDFLFTIPKNTLRGNLFGYDGMRLGASMRMADGQLLTLRRRKGNGKTLIDSDGAVLDETVLAPILGAVTRERFTTLFGLNHETLRSGGDRLLHADGDIGRLIVEAGGGLRALVGRLEAINDEAGSLFAKTRAQSRTFYQGLTAYEAADKQVRTHQLSRDVYEQTRKAAENAALAAAALREERRDLSAKIAGLERVLRVAPLLREREQYILECAAFADTVDYPHGFSTRVREALTWHEEATKALALAIERSEKLKARIDNLSVSPTVSAAEQVIRSLSERALHVAKARSDRSNRQREIDRGEAQLASLRRILGLPPEGDLADKLPEPAAIERVRALATEAIERKPALANTERRVLELTEALEQIDARIGAARMEGFDRPLDIASSQFASLAAQKAGIEARRRNAEAGSQRIQAELAALGADSIDALGNLPCPTPDRVRAEQAARDAIKRNQVEQERLKREAIAESNAGLETIESLQATGPVATDAAIAEARAARGAHWNPIRAAFVEGRVDGVPDMRRDAAEAFDIQIRDADSLADRRAEEAERAASLLEAQRRVARARQKASAADLELSALAEQLSEREEIFAAPFPELFRRHSTLVALLGFAERRLELLDQAAGARAQADEIRVDVAQLTPTIELLEQAETKLGLGAAGGFAARVQALQAALSRRQQRFNDLARDVREQQALAPQLKSAKKELDRVCSEQQIWDEAWPDAIRALGLTATTTPAEASTLVTEWAGARGVLTAIAQTRQRLARMDEEEAKLKVEVAQTAHELNLEVADDAVADARTLQGRWDANEAVRVQHDSLRPDHEEAKIAAELAEKGLTQADQALASLATTIGVEIGDLARNAGRFDSRVALEDRRVQAERTAMEAGDRLPIATLKEQWGDRDLDTIRATLDEARARSAQINVDLEDAILAEKEARDAMVAFANETQVNHAVVQRESATAQMHMALERYLELSLASDVVSAAMAQVRAEQQDPLVARAGVLFAAMTRGEFSGIDTDIDDRGTPVVVGKRSNGARTSIALMSDGTRDQLFLAFRLASLENYSASTEPLPFIADDILVHFDDARAQATLDLLATFGAHNQVLLFTHHQSVRDAAGRLAADGRANIVDLDAAA